MLRGNILYKKRDRRVTRILVNKEKYIIYNIQGNEEKRVIL